MKKFLLVVFVGMVLALDMYAAANDIAKHFEEIERQEEIAEVVYTE